jgi:hypothetical protein
MELHVLANRNSLDKMENRWTGRWRSNYEDDVDKSSEQDKVDVQFRASYFMTTNGIKFGNCVALQS